jgi:type IV pilus assembly protein PilP
MRKQFKQHFIIVALSLLISCTLWSCGEQRKNAKAPVISKKISVQKKPDSAKTSAKAKLDASVKTPDSKAADDEDSTVAKRIYDPEERLNPFTPLFRAENKGAVDEPTGKPSRKKRVPQTPLERISLEQLKLTAIIRASSGNRALVEDSSGKGYIIKNGTYIGLNSGLVTQINTNNVIVEEELENLMGELILQNTEIKLQKPAGE